MEFFNKKEEVLEVVLTNYGRDKLAAGQFNPTFYAFFDDDVQYDVSGSGYTENQNSSESRIQSDTPKLKLIPTREGAETRVNRFIDNVSSSFNAVIGGHSSDPANNVEIFQQQPYGDKGKLDAYPLGRSSYNTQNAPAWQMEILSNPSSSSGQRFLNEDDFIQPIPQIDITIDYETFFKQGQITSDSITGYLGDPPGNIFLALKENYLMIELLENNTPFEKQNFDIEVLHSGSDGQYVQLSSAPQSDTEFISPTEGNIEYWMNVLVDGEIPQEVIRELNISDNAVSTNASRLKLNRDLYSTENEEPC
tara:strand:+ start:6757 stop:7677 length:921 start_codon:yes stop_codon:yes gene_type:complete